MRKIAKALAIAITSITHAFAFLYAWSYFGAATSFSIGSTTDSFIASALAASLTTAAIATTPLALLAGFVGGTRLIVPSIAMFLATWVGCSFYFGRPNVLPLFAELSSIGVVGTILYLAGSQASRG